MRIDNKEYIKLNIKESLYYYIIKDYENLKDIDLNKVERKIYLDFIKYISKEYKIKLIKEINNFKEDLIYYEINKNNILLNIIEDNIY